MKYSKLFPKTLRQAPVGAESINHQLLVRAGFIHQEMAGVYTYLPLGWKVLNKISNIVREEMDKIGGQEILMPVLHPGENWKKTGRFSSFDTLYKLKGAKDKDLVLGPTHEEIIYPLLAENINSYKDLPLYLYQIQTKFRDEPRAKAGLLRTREFMMKDLYAFHESDEERNEYYKIVREAYLKIFKKLGLSVLVTKASGGTFSDLSEEFQVITPSGEDTVLVCNRCSVAINKEIAEDKKCPQCNGNLKEERSIEVGNIFPLKRSYAEVFNLYFTDKGGEKKIVSAGCFGLGISRTMGAIAEVFHDDKGIIWPETVAPFQVHLVGLDLEEESVKGEAERIYKLLQAERVEVLFDDRVEVSAGAKFADADLIGISYRVVISKKTGDQLEVKKRVEKETKFVTFEQFLEIVKNPR
ncbi:MAG: His/Gly/Thr/Pro-type tRNA ligase C-terminal domain-containing protein [Candidatus Daviesbacteria bacterium]|nr:His/Gly/Thr/Pro-type tRNA ligase C-terminal domain-containing protein [Candidatus Daviesbacteria bacterium]